MNEDAISSGNDLEQGGMTHTVVVETATVPGQGALKKGFYGKHTIESDEPEGYGGNDEAPPPLAYAALALGW